jgi:large subunit ribosomal protein L24
MKLRRATRVVVLAGKDKGKEGRRQCGHPHRQQGRRRRASTPPRSTASPPAMEQGGIIEIDMPIDVSNVALISRRRQAHPRRLQGRGRRHQGARVAKRTGEEIS